MLSIFINHVPGNFLASFTHRNFGVSDAAELFVLLAGVSASFAYMRKFEPGARAQITARVWLRAFFLYVAHLALLLIAFAVVGGASVLSEDARILQLFHLDILTEQPVETLVGMSLLTFQPAYLNILPLYVAVLLMAPVLMALVRASTALGLAVSLGVYLAAQLFDLAPPVWPGGGTWFFNPVAWQLLFACGLALGKLIIVGAPAPRSRVLDIAAPAYLAACAAWAMLGFPVPLDLSPLPSFVWDFDKTNLALPRVLHVLALVYCVSRLPLEGVLRAAAWSQPFIQMGRQSLPVFCFGTVLALAAQVTRPQFENTLAFDVVALALGMLLQWLLAWGLEWQKADRNTQRRSAIVAA